MLLARTAALDSVARDRVRYEPHRLKSRGAAFERFETASADERRDLTRVCMTQLDFGASERHGIELFACGITPAGHSICACIHGFTPFFFIRQRAAWSDEQCAAVLVALESELKRLVHAKEADAELDESDCESDSGTESECEEEEVGGGGDDDASAVVNLLKRRRSSSRQKAKRPKKRFKKFVRRAGSLNDQEYEALCAQPQWIVACDVVTGAPFRSYIGLARRHAYLCVRVVSPKLVTLCRALLEGVDGETPRTEWLRAETLAADVRAHLSAMDLRSTFSGALPKSDLCDDGRPVFELFEAHMDFAVRFLVEKQLRAAAWWAIDAAHAETRVPTTTRRATTDYELCVHADAVTMVDADEESPCAPGTTLQNTLPDLLVMAYDLECINTRGRFPSAALGDEIVIVSFSLYRLGTMDHRVDYVFVVPPRGLAQSIDMTSLPDNCAALRVFKFANEVEMLMEFSRAVVAIDPDVVTGYFSNVFDANYLQERARQLRLWDFKNVGRMPSLQGHSALYITRPRVTRGTTKVDVMVGGRIVLDLWRWVTTPGPGKAFSDTRLDAVASEILRRKKVTMPPDRIAHAYLLNDATLGRLVWYASVDTQLLHELDAARQIIAEYLEQARCRCIPPQQVHDRGTEHSVQAALSFYMHSKFLATPLRDRRLLIPTRRRDKPFVVEDKFEGGMVRQPERGFYESTVFVEDFASLYPSAMLQNNMGLDTKVDPAVIDEEALVEGRDYTRRPTLVRDREGVPLYDADTLQPRLEPFSDKTSACYLTMTYLKSIVSDFLEDLKRLRTSYKSQMERAIAEVERLEAPGAPPMTPLLVARRNALKKVIMLMSMRELQIKLLMNSTYGIFGSLTSPLSDPELAADVTWWGRFLSGWAGFIVETLFSRRRGFAYDCRVIYGDSVTGDTPIPCIHTSPLDGVQTFVYRTIDELGDGNWKAREGGKEECAPLPNLRVWTDTGLTSIRRVIRHRCAKPLKRVLTHTGVVDVTTDHSLLTPDGAKITPAECHVGTPLLHSDLPPSRSDSELTTTFTIDQAYAWGLFYADGSCGDYECESGSKASWAINNLDRAFLKRAAKGLHESEQDMRFKIYETVESSGVYKLIATSPNNYGGVKAFVARWRALFYNKSRLKIVPDVILNSPREIRQAFFDGYYAGDGDNDALGYTRFDNKGKIGAASLYYLAASLGYAVSINTRGDKTDIYRMTCTTGKQRKRPDQIKRIVDVTHLYPSAVVYDLETGSHHFSAGVGRLVVHNTDSIFVVVDGLTEAEFESAGGRQIGIDMQDAVNLHMPRPHSITSEKHYTVLLLRGKKMYAGKKFMPKQLLPKLDVKGMSMVKRDYCQLVRRVVQRTLHIMIMEGSRADAIAYARREVGALLSGHVRLDELIQSKSLSSNPHAYKTVNKAGRRVTLLPHVQQALRMAAAEPNNAPRAGDRISTVYCLTARHSKAGRAAKQSKGDQAVSPMEAHAQQIPINVEHYFSQLKKELVKIMQAALGGVSQVERSVFTPDVLRKRPRAEISKASPLFAFVQRTQNHCEGCGDLLDARSAATAPFCVDRCVQREAELRREADEAREEAVRVKRQCLRVCENCVLGDAATEAQRTAAATISEIENCKSEACSNQWARLAAQKALDDADVHVAKRRRRV